jgi:hypothetical protein
LGTPKRVMPSTCEFTRKGSVGEWGWWGLLLCRCARLFLLAQTALWARGT